MSASVPCRPWSQAEVLLEGPATTNPYVDVEAWAELVHTDGTRLVRPLFWAGGTTWGLRFASPRADGRWTWTLDGPDAGRLSPAGGTFEVEAAADEHAHPALRHGFPRLAPQQRSLVHPDGRSWFMVVDTAWAMPWRARLDEVETYARDRAAKGFTAVLLMSVQPDMRATGPEARGVDEGFAVGFRDLPDGHLNRLEPAYFAEVDAIVDVLVAHGLTPVLQPVFFGFGWKGLDVAGPVVPPAEYARYARYLVARYGAQPVVWLPGADGAGDEPQVEAAGRELEAWDAYGHPTGIHYRPHHRDDVHQAAGWLDFQAAQTGHNGDHVPDRVATMWAQQPAKAVMNGEPTYERTGRPHVATGWWQGHEAWSNLCAGALLGVAYGAAGLWQWRLHRDEPGHAAFFLDAASGWREALDFEGSTYVGLVGRILDGLPLAGAAPCWDVAINGRGLLDPGVLYVGYAEHGGPWLFLDGEGRLPSRCWVLDPRTGEVLHAGPTPPDGTPLDQPYDRPSVLICAEEEPAHVRRTAG